MGDIKRNYEGSYSTRAQKWTKYLKNWRYNYFYSRDLKHRQVLTISFLIKKFACPSCNFSEKIVFFITISFLFLLSLASAIEHPHDSTYPRREGKS